MAPIVSIPHSFPINLKTLKHFLASLGWNYTNKTFKLAANSYWRRHNDRFELFRNYQGAELYSWYEDHNYHQTDVTGGKFTITDQWIGGSTTIGMDLRNEHIYSNVLGNIMDSRVNVPFESNKKYTREDNRFFNGFFLSTILLQLLILTLLPGSGSRQPDNSGRILMEV